MRELILLLLVSSCLQIKAQNNLTTTIIEGGKTLVDLVRVFKTPKTVVAFSESPVAAISPDSCYSKGLSDITYKNKLQKIVQISLYKRNGAIYTTAALSLRIGINSQESLYEVPVGIYKFKIECDEPDGRKSILSEGEIKVNACDKFVREIK
jgi:hypothetical protein